MSLTEEKNKVLDELKEVRNKIQAYEDGTCKIPGNIALNSDMFFFLL